MTDADQLSASLVDIMKIIPESPGMSMSTLHDFFTFVPSRIGNNQTLDAAISCLVQGYHSLIRQWPIDRKPQDDDAYLNALRKLQLSLDDPRERNSAETLCGALVLATYEFFRSKSPGDIQWLAHAGGAAAMLQARGPNAFTTDFEQSLLLAHHEAVVSRERRFDHKINPLKLLRCSTRYSKERNAISTRTNGFTHWSNPSANSPQQTRK